MARRWFVTGATGFLGGRLVEELRAAGDEVVALVRDQTDASRLEARGVEVARGDITEKPSLVLPMRDVDGVFHLAAYCKVGAADVWRAERVNVRGTQNVLAAMRESGVPRGVYTSSVAVFGDTRGRLAKEGDPYVGPRGKPWSSEDKGHFFSEYDRTKWAAHHEVAKPMIAGGLPLTIVQPGLVYGSSAEAPFARLLRVYLQGRLRAVPEGAAFSWGHVDDVAHAHVLAMDLGVPGEEYVTAGPAHTLVEMLEIAAAHTGIPPPSRKLSPRTVRGLARVSALLEAVGVPVREQYASEALRSVAGVTHLGDDGKAQQALGFTPRPLAEGLPDVLDAERARLEEAGKRVGR